MILADRSCDAGMYQPISKDNKLVMLMGLPRSGKSTWALEQGYPIVCPDAIRFAKTGQRWWGPIEHEVWATARTMVRALFLAGHKIVILDATALKRKQRDEFKCSDDVQWERYVQIIETDIEVCKYRAAETYPELVEIIDWFDQNKEAVQPDEHLQMWGMIKDGKVIYRARETRG